MTIAIYSRKSKFTGKGDSIANQVEMCKQRARQYLDTKNVPETDAEILIYEDEGFSGKNTARPEFQKLLAAVKANEINCVICYKLDRISRNVGDFAQTYEIFERHKADFLCAGETYDTTTPSGRAMMGMVSVFAQMEREVTAERVRDNMHMLARSGRWLGGHAPTGFQSSKEERVDLDGKIRSSFKLVPVKDELELVKFIYQRFMETQSISGTARYLAQNNIRTKNGNDFTNISVKDILRNPVYCIAGDEAGNYFRESGADICFEENESDNRHGFMPFNRTVSGKDGQVKNEIKDWLIAIGKHDGIIQADKWVKTQRILDAKRGKSKAAVRTPHKSDALLSGLLVCEKCKSAMRPHVHTNRKNADGVTPYYYICELKERTSKARCDMLNANGVALDKAIMEKLASYEQTDSSIHKSLLELKKRLSEQKESANKQQGFLECELATKKKEIDNLISAIAKDGMQDAFTEQVRARLNTLAEQCKGLENELEKAALNNASYSDYEGRTEAAADTLKKLKAIMLTATAVEMRELLKSTLERIIWDGEQAHIFLSGE